MNKHIKELHNRACMLDMEQYPNSIPDGERIQQKFAELIVKRCADFVGMKIDCDDATKELLKIISNEMRAYFGVK